MGAYTRQHSFSAGEKPTENQWNVDIDGLISLVNGNLDRANVDYSSSDGICVKDQAMSVSEDWTFAKSIIHNGGWQNPIQVGTLRLWHDATTDVLRINHGSDPGSEIDGGEIAEGL